MRHRMSFAGLLIVWLLTQLSVVAGQVPQEPIRYVGVVVDERLGSASLTNIGDDGITRLVSLFTALNIKVQSLSAEEAIPDFIQMMVLIRPKTDLSFTELAHLWGFIRRGGHLLIAIDPLGHNQTRSESSKRHGLSSLLEAEYGISLQDDLIVQPWVDSEALSNVITSWTNIYPENAVISPIIAPLVTYGIPVHSWGGRSVWVDGASNNSNTRALLYTEDGYGESTVPNFKAEKQDPFIFDIASDYQGRLFLGAVAQNIETGSRLALVGDSEIFQNIYGLTRNLDNDKLPAYVGNYLFAQRLTAWLIGLPEADWPSLPSEFTWMLLDGQQDDWPSNALNVELRAGIADSVEINQIRALENDQFVYLWFGLSTPIPPVTEVTITTQSGNVISMKQDGTVQVGDNRIEDGQVYLGASIEARLPRRLFALNDRTITKICINAALMSEPRCIEIGMRPTPTGKFDPVPLRFPNGPEAFTANDANIRTKPDPNADLVILVTPRTPFVVVGRTPASDWFFVRNAAFEGWVDANLLYLNANPLAVPIMPS